MWGECSYIIRGKNRRRVFLALETPKTPTQLSDELKIHLSHVSRALGEFESKKLVVCLTPAEKVGRIYRLTGRGKRVLKMVKGLSAERSPRPPRLSQSGKSAKIG